MRIKKTSHRLWTFRWSTNCTRTVCCRIWNKRERFETIKNAFLKSDNMKAPVGSGKKPTSSREVLTIRLSTGVSSSRQSLRMDVGIGSREFDLLGEDDMIFFELRLYVQCGIFQEARHRNDYQYILCSLGRSKKSPNLGELILSCRQSSWHIDWLIQSAAMRWQDIFICPVQ